MDDRPSGGHDRGSPLPPGGAFEIAGPGCRRQRHSSGACKCARIKRLGQRSQRHRQCGQSARDTAAGHHPRARTHSIRSRCYLPNVPGAAIGQDETRAACAIRISPLGYPGGRQGERQAARQSYKHLQGMLIDIRDTSLSPPRPKPSASGQPHGPAGSAAGELLQMFRVPGPLHRDLRDGAVDVADIVGREFHRRRADVLLRAMQFCGAGGSERSTASGPAARRSGSGPASPASGQPACRADLRASHPIGFSAWDGRRQRRRANARAMINSAIPIRWAARWSPPLRSCGIRKTDAELD